MDAESIKPARMAGKICITTTTDHKYMEGVKVLFKTIRRYTDCTGIDFKVITADPIVIEEFGEENCYIVTEEIRARYANVKYTPELPKEQYEPSWYRYELFNFKGYDRVICIDSDCMCLKDISYLFSEELNEYDIVSVEDHIISKCFTALVPELERQGLNFTGLTQRLAEGKTDIQPALIVANKGVVNEEWYKRLIDFANNSIFLYSIDQGILNEFIYKDNLRIKLLPLEWDYQDLYEIHCPTVPVPEHPIIVHCQESKPFKKARADVNNIVVRWHDQWWNEHNDDMTKTIVAIIVWNRFENLNRWIHCWKQCDHAGATLVVIHNLENDNARYRKLCQDNNILYVPRENIGFDIGAFQDICKERLTGFPNNWENLIWFTDDCIPMAKDFVSKFTNKLINNQMPCYEISPRPIPHVRTTGFMMTKAMSKKLRFPHDPIIARADCYRFEHQDFNLYDQLVASGLKPVMVSRILKFSPVWDWGLRKFLKLMPQHEQVFSIPPPEPVYPVEQASPTPALNISSGPTLDELAIKHKADKSSEFHNFAVKYDAILSKFRDSFKTVMEIGVAQGQSIKMWTDYFPNATIHGVDISPASSICTEYSPRIKFHLTDQRNLEQLKDLEQFSLFDLIIDDGSHCWNEQILSFQALFPYVKKGGIYIIEDTCTSYWNEYNNNPISCINYFKGLIDEVNLNGVKAKANNTPMPEFVDAVMVDGWNKGWQRREDCYENVPDFESIQFFNSIIVVYKRK